MSVQVESLPMQSPHIASILASIRTISDEERLIFHGVTWEEYQELLDELGEHRHVLVSYSEGVLEIMPLSHRHERYKEFILRLVGGMTEELDIELITAGSTTLEREDIERGVEPDTSFFIQHAAEMIGQDTHDLFTDPPPDIVVEVDIFHPSYSKKPIYAAIGVPEFWSYGKKGFQIFKLEGGSYEETESSPTFPFLQAAVFEAFIERGKTEGHNAVIKSFREWVRANKP
jgi:Uma2 family endonuclease